MAREDVDRRTFLAGAATGGVAGMAALAGCGGQSGGGGDGTDTDTDGSGGGGGDGTAELGEQLPTYTYTNNPQSYSPQRHDSINLIADQLGEAGFDVEVEVMEWGTLFSTVTQDHEYDFATWWTFFTIDPGLLLPQYFHSSNTGGGEGNYSGYQNEDLDPQLREQLTISDPEERASVMHDIQGSLMDDVPMMPIAHMPSLAIHNSDQTGNWQYQLNNGYNSFWAMANVEVDNEESALVGTWPESLSTVNVLGHNGESKHVHQFTMMYDRLIRFDPDVSPYGEYSLATDWERVDDSTMEYTIREGHTFHDGETLTAEDVAFSFNYIKENQVPVYSQQIQYYEGAEVVDDTTVRINLAQNLGPANIVLGSQIPILPKHKWEGRSNPTQASIDNPVGSGPLQFDYWDTGSEFGLTAFEDHWVDLSFDRRYWRIVPESSTQWELLLNGDINYMPFGGISRQLNENQDEPQIGVESSPGTSFWHMTQNNRSDGLAQPAVRKAAVNCIPRTAIVQQILYDFPERGFNVVSEAFGNLHTEDVPTYEEGVDVARSRLSDAGFGWDDDGNLHFPAE